MSEEIVNPSLTIFGTPWVGTAISSLGGFSITSNPITSNPITTEPEGPVAVSFRCADRAGNIGSFNTISFITQVVIDCTPPLITQTDLTAELTGPGGAPVAFSPTATDVLGAIASVTGIPPSGSFFAAGTTPISVSATDSAGNTGSGSFNLTVLKAADFWPDLYFNQTTNNGDASDGADPDKDGLVNLIERAFNLHPLQAGTGTLTSGSGISGLPLVTPQGEGENRRLRIEYLRRKTASLPGISYEAQFSTTLDPAWTPASGESVLSLNDRWERVIVEDSPGDMQNFGRVKVTTP